MKIMAKTIIPLMALIGLTLLNGISGVTNPKKIMEATDEINKVHFVNVYNLELLNGNVAKLQRIVYEHCVSETEATKRDLEEEIDTIYNENTGIMEILDASVTENNAGLYQTFKEDYAKFTSFVMDLPQQIYDDCE